MGSWSGNRRGGDREGGVELEGGFASEKSRTGAIKKAEFGVDGEEGQSAPRAKKAT